MTTGLLTASTIPYCDPGHFQSSVHLTSLLCCVSVRPRTSPNFCRFSHMCSVANLLLVHTFQRLYLGKEGSRHSCSPLHMTDGCFGLFQMPISHSLHCAAPFIPIQMPIVTVVQCRCWKSVLFLVVLKVSCNSKLPCLTFHQLLLYLCSI